MSTAKGGASQPPNMRLPGKAGGAVAVRRTLASTICQIADPTQVPRPRQLRDASTVMRSRPAHQSMINRRFNDRASCPARQSQKPALARRPRIHSPASGKGGHESGEARILDRIRGPGCRIYFIIGSVFLQTNLPCNISNDRDGVTVTTRLPVILLNVPYVLFTYDSGTSVQDWL